MNDNLFFSGQDSISSVFEVHLKSKISEHNCRSSGNISRNNIRHQILQEVFLKLRENICLFHKENMLVSRLH